MTVDCTNLLNLRHLHEEGDKGLLNPYPAADEVLSWDEVIPYGKSDENELVIVAYGRKTDCHLVTFARKLNSSFVKGPEDFSQQTQYQCHCC